MVISLAPLQGYTEFPLRNALHKYIGGIDTYYTPYLKFENDGSLRQKFVRDILPENNQNINVIPQILVNNSIDFFKFHDLIKNNGYTEINLNFGCPYPMVANKQLGSGILPFPETIDRLLHEIFEKTQLKVSIKFRSGYQSPEEIVPIISIFNNYPIHELIYHPRIGKQLYKGNADIETFKTISTLSNQKLAYNGDINTIENYQVISKNISSNNHFMIGRGLLMNPFLAYEIKNGILELGAKKEKFFQLHSDIFEHYSNALSGDAHVLNKLIHLWEYFSHLFENQHKVYKQIKKCKKLSNYKFLIKEISNNESLASSK
ncbi:MAG: tRNA-dihydrouridine synthase family protein [Salinivirgaceae bacterium]|nr:tRNA-dihydrouridine synthase family protein [Salinivirgaceae bacterium]